MIETAQGVEAGNRLPKNHFETGQVLIGLGELRARVAEEVLQVGDLVPEIDSQALESFPPEIPQMWRIASAMPNPPFGEIDRYVLFSVGLLDIGLLSKEPLAKQRKQGVSRAVW